MIFCNLEDLIKYRTVNKNLSTAIDFILETDLDKLSMGKTKIDGDNVYVTKMKIIAQMEEDMTFECHRKYMDIHINLEGYEYIYISDKSNLIVKNEYNIDEDYELFLSRENSSKILLKKDNVIIIDANEAHKPGIFAETEQIKKIVIKVRI